MNLDDDAHCWPFIQRAVYPRTGALTMADFISNSAIAPRIRPQRRACGGVQLRPRARKMADFTANSATDNAPSADDDERKEHRSRCPLSKGDDS